MSLTTGAGPLSRSGTGQLSADLSSAPAHLLFLHDVPVRVRGEVAGEVVLDTTRARMLHETGLLPQWYVPLEHVREDLLTRTATSTHCPFKGDASSWTLSVGDRVEPDLFWEYETPLPAISGLAGLVAAPFERLDAWYEEDQPVLGHPRDPFHRVSTYSSSREVEVRAGGEVVARSRRPVALAETGLPVRWYLPEEDLRGDLLEPSTTRTTCPYKGVATYRSLRAGGARVDDAVWTHPEPLGEVLAVRDHACVLGDGVQTFVDGVPAQG